MTCPSCGARIADKAIVCYRCGKATPTWAVPPSRQSTGKDPRRSVWRWVVAAVVVIAGIIYFLYFSPSETPPGL